MRLIFSSRSTAAAMDMPRSLCLSAKIGREAVGKNEIIVLSEKIDVSSAMKGFFVAKSFTADARAQAAKDKRITLLVVTEHNAAETPVPIGVEHLMIKTGDPNVLLQKLEETPSAAQPFEMAGREVHLNGLPIDLVKYVKDLSTGACHEKAKQMNLGELPDGDYPATAAIALKYSEGELMLGEIPLVGMKITTNFVATIIRPKLHVHFDVIGRGRSYQFEPIVSPEGTFVYEFATKSS